MAMSVLEFPMNYICNIMDVVVGPSLTGIHHQIQHKTEHGQRYYTDPLGNYHPVSI